MNLFSFPWIQSRPSLRTTGIALAVTLMSYGFFSAGASAQALGVTVNNPQSFQQQLLGYARQAAQLAHEVSTDASTLATLQNIEMKAQSLGSNIQLFDQQLQQITDSNSIIQSACPGANAGLTADLLGSLASALSPNQPVATRQQMICAEIVLFQIDEYNKTATALNAVGGANKSTLNQLNDLISSVGTLGTTSNATAQADNIIAQIQGAMGTWQTQIQADESIIGTLQKQQSMLATIAMKGDNTVLGTVVQAAALKTAFTINQ